MKATANENDLKLLSFPSYNLIEPLPSDCRQVVGAGQAGLVSRGRL